MHTRRRFLEANLATLAVFGCAQAPPSSDNAAVVQAVNDVREREIGAFAAGDVEGLVAVFAPDAHLMPPNQPVVMGQEALREWAQAILDQFTVSGRYTSSDVTVTGDYAIERYTGELSLTPKAGGAAMTEVIKGIHVYQRQVDENWRILHDVWNSDAAPPVASPAPTNP